MSSLCLVCVSFVSSSEIQNVPCLRPVLDRGSALAPGPGLANALAELCLDCVWGALGVFLSCLGLAAHTLKLPG